MNVSRIMPEVIPDEAGEDRALWVIEQDYIYALSDESNDCHNTFDESLKEHAIDEILKNAIFSPYDESIPLAMAYAMWRLEE
jgi:hypothetical protein